ncbi:MAG TPA: TonB-dependent receptor, partial [Myxococcota bacterium]
MRTLRPAVVVVAAVIVAVAIFAAPARAAIIEGTIREAGTRRPVPAVLVAVSGSDVTATSDDQGAYVLDFEDSRVTSANLEIDTPGFVPAVVHVALVRGGSTSVDVYLKAKPGEETVVRERRSRDNVARGVHHIEGNEVSEMPGTYGDPAKAIENFPGMGRVVLSQGSLFIRGATPQQSNVFVDDYEVPDLYHFVGSTSVINAPFVDSVELVPGAFSARYGRSIGGIVTLKTKKLETDDVHGEAKADVIDAGAFVGVPLSDNLAVGASARRSYLDVIRNIQRATSGTGDAVLLVPTYWDYQLKLDWDPAP